MLEDAISTVHALYFFQNKPLSWTDRSSSLCRDLSKSRRSELLRASKVTLMLRGIMRRKRLQK